jgi:hypothetical protein
VAGLASAVSNVRADEQQQENALLKFVGDLSEEEVEREIAKRQSH